MESKLWITNHAKSDCSDYHPQRQDSDGRKESSSEIGAGTVNGPGGKQDAGETLFDCLVRETREELRIELDRTTTVKTNIITFFFGNEPSFEVHFYHAPDFSGEPQTTRSMIPEWYDISELPLDRLLESDRDWFPQVVREERFNANVYYREKAKACLCMGPFEPFVDHD